MAQYAVFIYEGVAELPPEIIEGHVNLPDRIAAEGGRVVAGLGFQSPDTATTIRGDLVTDGPFIETKEALAGLFVLEARDLDHAMALAKLTPIVEGGVEVRPLFDYRHLGSR